MSDKKQLRDREGRQLPHIPTCESRKIVSEYAMIGTRQEVIATVLEINDKTLRKHYRRELEIAKAVANMEIGGALYRKALIQDDTTAQIFWMKTQGGFSEKQQLEITEVVKDTGEHEW